MRRILVVDDEAAITAVVADLLTDEGYAVSTARDGRQALVELAAVQPDLILCDLMMPELNGLELCRRLQADATTREIPVVLMSAGGERTVESGCRYAAFVHKPFQIDRLVQTIAEVLRGGPG